MTRMLHQALNKYQKDGLGSVLRRSISFMYNSYLRPRMPRTKLKYNGVTVCAGRWFDDVVPWDVPIHPHPEAYEVGLCSGIRKHVVAGQTVVLVGGGWGVSSVVAGRNVGSSGQVVTYEGSRQYAQRVRETVKINGVCDRVSVQNKVVSEAFELKQGSSSDTIDPQSLPACDVLVLDCEGAELSILEELENRPPTVIVETHGRLGSPEDAVRSLLDDQGYTVVSQSLAEIGELQPLMERNGVYVLVACLNQDETCGQSAK